MAELVPDKPLKPCLVICPIGEEGTEERKRSNQVLKYIIEPIAKKCGFKADRADEISKPGVITTQIIDRLLNDELIIADLTSRNANVFYELAVRHAIKKPVVQLIGADERIPFDVSSSRTIRFDWQDMASQENCRRLARGVLPPGWPPDDGPGPWQARHWPWTAATDHARRRPDER